MSTFSTERYSLGELQMKKLIVGISTAAFLLGTVACGGADKGMADPSDATDAADDAGGEKKGLEKFEGNKMEKSDEEEE
jgi:hypothetical protein